VGRLQGLHKSRYGHGLVAGRGMVHVTKANIARLFEQGSKGKGGIIEAAQAYWSGGPCPADNCPKCCYHSPAKVHLRSLLEHMGRVRAFLDAPWSCCENRRCLCFMVTLPHLI